MTIWQVLWGEIEYQRNCEVKGNIQVFKKEVGYYQIILCIRWSKHTEYVWRKNQGLGFLNNQPKRHNFCVARQCNENAHEAWMPIMDKYEVSEEKKKSFEWNYKQVEHMQDKQHKSTSWHMFQWSIWLKY